MFEVWPAPAGHTSKNLNIKFMGKKVSPHSFRLGITRSWNSLWYSSNNYKQQFLQDLEIRKFLQTKLKKASISKIIIIRQSGKIEVEIFSAKPGIIVGRGGDNIQKLTKELEKEFSESFKINVQEVRNPDIDSDIIVQSIAEQISRRFPYRRVIKMAIDRAKDNGVKGIKIKVAGRLNGVDIARSESYNWGTVPLHTLRAKIDYATAKAPTTYGTIGVKVWVYHGLVFKNEKLNEF